MGSSLILSRNLIGCLEDWNVVYGEKLVSNSCNFKFFFSFTYTGGSTGSNQKGTIIGIVVAFVVLFIIIIIFVCWYKRHLKKKYAKFLEPNENFVVSRVFFFIRLYSIAFNVKFNLILFYLTNVCTE